MTILKLHKLLSEEIKKGNGRKPVFIDKSTFTHPLEGDGCVILPLEDCLIRCIDQIDDDGFTKWNKDGSQASRLCFVMLGEHRDEAKLREHDFNL